MKRLVTNYVALTLTVLAVLAYVVLYWAIGNVTAKLIVDGLAIGVGFVIMYTWGPAAISAIRHGVQKDSSKIVLTVWMIWTIVVVQRVFVIVSTFLGNPPWLINSVIPGVIVTLAFVAGMYAAVAPVQTDSPMESKKELINLIIAAVLGLAVATCVVMFYLLQQAIK